MHEELCADEDADLHDAEVALVGMVMVMVMVEMMMMLMMMMMMMMTMLMMMMMMIMMTVMRPQMMTKPTSVVMLPQPLMLWDGLGHLLRMSLLLLQPQIVLLGEELTMAVARSLMWLVQANAGGG